MISLSDCPGSDKGMHYETNCGDLIKVVWWDGQGACLFCKRLERGRFVWPSPAHGRVSVSSAQLAMLLDHP